MCDFAYRGGPGSQQQKQKASAQRRPFGACGKFWGPFFGDGEITVFAPGEGKTFYSYRSAFYICGRRPAGENGQNEHEGRAL